MRNQTGQLRPRCSSGCAVTEVENGARFKRRDTSPLSRIGCGVRPSSGAATPERLSASQFWLAIGTLHDAAPEDGRTPEALDQSSQFEGRLEISRLQCEGLRSGSQRGNGKDRKTMTENRPLRPSAKDSAPSALNMRFLPRRTQSLPQRAAEHNRTGSVAAWNSLVQPINNRGIQSRFRDAPSLRYSRGIVPRAGRIRHPPGPGTR